MSCADREQQAIERVVEEALYRAKSDYPPLRHSEIIRIVSDVWEEHIERLEYEKSSLRLEMDALEHQRVSNNQYLLDRIERLEQVVKAWDHFEAVSCLQHPPPTEVRRARLDARRARADLEPGDPR